MNKQGLMAACAVACIAVGALAGACATHFYERHELMSSVGDPREGYAVVNRLVDKPREHLLSIGYCVGYNDAIREYAHQRARFYALIGSVPGPQSEAQRRFSLLSDQELDASKISSSVQSTTDMFDFFIRMPFATAAVDFNRNRTECPSETLIPERTVMLSPDFG